MKIFISVLVTAGFMGILSAQEFQWHEGKEVRKIYLQPALAISFSMGTGTGKESSKALSSAEEEDGKKLVRKVGAARIYQVPSSFQAKLKESKVLAEEATSSPSLWSPVFSTDPEGTFPMALPGGVQVQFKKGVNEEKVRQWLKKKGLKLKLNQAARDRTWRLQSPAGWASLELAEKLRNDPLVEAASPDWWRPMVLK